MEKRTMIYLERDPGFAARMKDVAGSFFTGKPRQFHGRITSKGYKIDSEGDRPSRWIVEGHDNGVIPTSAYENLVQALRKRREKKSTDVLRVEYIPVPETNKGEVYNLDPRPALVIRPNYDSKRGLYIKGWDLQGRVGCDLRRAA